METETLQQSTLDLIRYSGQRLAAAELVALVDFDEPQRVAKAFSDPAEREAFEEGIGIAYDLEVSPKRTPEGEAFYRTLLRAAHVY